MTNVDQHVHIEWRGGTCRVKWWSGEYLPSGRKRYESKGGFTDEDEAYRHGQDKLYEIRHGTHVKNRDGATLFTDWAEDWIKSVDLKPNTDRNYRSALRKHIRPYFDSWAISEIDVLAFRAFKKHVSSTLSPGSARIVMTLLAMILDDAVPRLIRVSPVERTKRRGTYRKQSRRERKRDVQMESIEQLARNLELLIGPAGYVLPWTMVMTGMRPGELFGLKRQYCYPSWPGSDPRDGDDDGRYADDLERYGNAPGLMPAIRVQQQVQSAGGFHLCPPKYDSFRTLVIPPFLASMLEQLLASHESEWVFPSVRGANLGGVRWHVNYWRPAADGSAAHPKVRRCDPRITAVAGWEGKRMYLLRHAHKAWLDEDGHSRFAVETRQGHEVPGVEGDYSNVTVAMERMIMESLERRWQEFQASVNS
ncbi:N-terminal phage integrase SAM-like domain-containing protein [Streptomyces venezuelae]|uniref:integrase n=1 Tax=Streptomyces sp. B6(2022) TaxID=3404749 RepID=UPI00311E8445